MNCPKCGAQMQKPGDQGGSMWVCYTCGTVVQSFVGMPQQWGRFAELEIRLLLVS